jgi:hypothetical protein
MTDNLLQVSSPHCRQKLATSEAINPAQSNITVIALPHDVM